MKEAKGGKWKGENLILRLECGNQVLHEGRCAELAFPFQIGRKRSCAWNVPDAERSVSGVHAEVFLKKNAVYIRDEGSRNGIFVMGSRVAEHRLQAGVQVSLGQCRLTVEEDRKSPRTAAVRFHQLVQLNGSEAGRKIDIRKDVTPVGLGVADGISCSDILVSRRHAEILHKPDDTCWVKDLESRNGTQVNGVALKGTERMLRDGDIVSFADLEFKFRDRGRDHSDGQLAKKICIALVTAAVSGSLLFLYRSITPSAKSLLADAKAYEMKENFSLANACLEKALTARGVEDYKNEIARKMRDISQWTNTLAIWRTTQTDFENRRWVVANRNLGTLMSGATKRWEWNVTTALERKRKAEQMRNLLNLFLEARRTYRGFSDRELGRETDVLQRHLQSMQNALREEWPGIPGAKLRDDMGDLCLAFDGLIKDLKAVDQTLAMVRGIPEEESPQIVDVLQKTGGFSQLADALKSLVDRAMKREETRADAAKKAKRVFYGSSVVKDKCERYIPILEVFDAAHGTLQSNLVAFVSFRPKGMVRELPTPTDQQLSLDPRFGGIERAMQKANDKLFGKLADNVRDQFQRMRQWKITDGETPACLKTLMDEDKVARAFSCDSLVPQKQRPPNSRRAFSGAYDEVLGIETFGDLLNAIDVQDGRELDGGRVMRPETDNRPAPVLCQAVNLFAQLAVSRKFLSSPDFVQMLGVTVPDGGTNQLKRLASIVSDLQGKKEMLVDSWWNRETGGIRERVLARGAALALDADGKILDVEKVEEFMRDKAEMRRQIKTLSDRINANPETVDENRAQILRIGIPGLFGVNRFWDESAREAERGGM